MFIGEYKHNLDAKGRIAIPAKFREQLRGGAVVTRGLDNCLSVYSTVGWKRIAKRLNDLPLTDANARAFARFMLAGAMSVDVDRVGRIVIPQYLRKFAKLSGSVVVAGLFDRVELWNETDWQAYQNKSETDATGIASKLTEWGI